MESTFTAQDLQVRGVAMPNRGMATATIQCTQHVDPVMARSFAQLAEVAVKKHNLERDSLLVSQLHNIISCYMPMIEWEGFGVGSGEPHNGGWGDSGRS